MKANKLTFPQIRKMFWDNSPQFKNEYRTKKKQNDYCCDIRCSFVDFVDFLLKDGQITERQANNITL